MNLYDAYVILLEATVEMDDDRQIRNARKRVAKKVEAIRQKRERAAQRNHRGGGVELCPGHPWHQHHTLYAHHTGRLTGRPNRPHPPNEWS